MSIGARIRQARKAKGLTQEELGKLLHVTGAAISHFERGRRDVDAKTLAKIARVLEKPIDFFLE